MTASPNAGGWLDISTAPKDGSAIDVWREDGGRETVHWGRPHHECGEAGQYCDSDWHRIRSDGWVCNTFDEFIGRKHNPFTHWRPLPGGPGSVSEGAAAEPEAGNAAEALKRVARIAADIIEWCDLVAKRPGDFPCRRPDDNLRGPLFDDLRRALADLGQEVAQP